MFFFDNINETTVYKTISKIAKFSWLKLEYIKFIDLNTTVNMNSIIVSFTYIINLPTSDT